VLDTERKGELCLLSSTLFWGLFPVITILSFTSLTPLISAGLSTLIAALLFGAILTVRQRWHELLIRAAWRDLALTTLFIGFLFYGLIFIGASYTTANNMAIIMLLEIFFNQIILSTWGKEKLTPLQLMGTPLMVGGALLVLYQGDLRFNPGDLILVAASAIPPFGNYYMQQARKKVSSITILSVRSFFGGLFLLFTGLLLESDLKAAAIADSMTFLLINGIFLLGLSKILWIEAIHRITISKATALSAGTPLITMFFSYFLLGETPTVQQMLGFIPIALGIFLLTKKIKLQ